MANTGMRMIMLEHLFASSTNPRKTFDQKQMDELTQSIKEKGVVQPILVRPIMKRNNGEDGMFEIVTGERRYRAAKSAGLKEIPSMVKDVSDQDALEIQVIENLHRANVHPLEEAEGYAVLMRRPGTTVASIAAKIGQSEKYVYDRIKLLCLTKKAKEYFIAGKFTPGHAIILARLTPEQQAQCLDIPSGGMFQYEHAGHLFDEKEDKSEEPFKSRSVRELQVWVDDHVRFEPEKVDQMIFPETAKVLEQVKEKAEKIVSITEDFHVQTSARNDERIIGPRSWVRADGKSGSKTCEYSVTGVFVVGPGRGTSIKVCTSKEKCKTHWGSWQKERVERAKGQDTPAALKAAENRKKEEQKRLDEQAKRDAWQKRYLKALPELLKSLGEEIKKRPASAAGVLAEIILDEVKPSGSKPNKALIDRGSTAEDFVRYLAHYILCEKATGWRGNEELLPLAKVLNFDLNKSINDLVPEAKATKKAGKNE